MKYTSINIQGNLISEDILQKIEEADIQGQTTKDFGFEPGVNLRSEIEYAWSRIKLDWKHFMERTEKLPSSDPYGTTITRRWMTGFFSTLGFDLSLQKSSLIGDNEQSYNISHTCQSLDDLPVHITGFNDTNHPEKNTLDIRSSGGTSRLSPHATIQEYLNVTEHLYALVTNGLLLRLVRDSGRLVKLTYIEFDLKRLLEEDKYSEFTLLYRLLHASRFPKSKQKTEESLLEKYYQDSIESGNRIRDGLSDAVKSSLIALGNGLLEHPENEELRKKIAAGRPDARDYYHQLLRLIYRLLFLMVTEERDLVFPEIQDEDKELDIDDLIKGIKYPTRKQKEIYYHYYSLIRLRKLSEKRYLQENQYTDLWQGLMQTFALFETGGAGQKLGILALGGELFSGNAMPDITSSKLNNKVLIECIRSLNEFEDQKHNLSFINYRALDVEELGSVYEGLLELEPVFTLENGKPKFTFKKGSERSSSGSHYTPEDLVKPLIQHSLEYLIEKRTADFYKEKTSAAETKKKLLDLKVCDVACGSGHILLSAARRIAIEVARVETREQQPNPTSFRHALKGVIRNCIYGVDKNPLAVELCKVALWLESHNPGEPLSFLDHRIKCGDAIVGLAHREELQNGIPNEAYKKLPGDDKEIVSTFLKKNREERTLREKGKDGVQLTTATDQKLLQQISGINQAIDEFSKMSENTPEEIEKKEIAYTKLTNSENLMRLKRLADIQVMHFFLEKNAVSKDYLVTDAQYHRYLRGEVRIPPDLETKASVEYAALKKFFHWFLEFPEVFQKGGFDCIIGNPPFYKGAGISSAYGDDYLNYIKHQFRPIGGQADLVAYFFRRAFNVSLKGGFLALISTNTISQGDSRKGSFEYILKNGGKINYAKKSMKWPGKASVSVSLIAINKDFKNVSYFIGNNRVEHISPYLDDESTDFVPLVLSSNESKSFRGVMMQGTGFLLDANQAKEMIAAKPSFKDVIKPYFNGDELNNTSDFISSRYIIDFSDYAYNEHITHNKTVLGPPYVVDFSDLHQIIENKVKPERMKAKEKRAKEYWWIFARTGGGLKKASYNLTHVFVCSRLTKHFNIVKLSKENVFADLCVIFAEESDSFFALMQSNIHIEWAWKNSSTLGIGTLNYSNQNAFNSFPFPVLEDFREILCSLGKQYQIHRDKLLKQLEFGLTELYNLFHNPKLNSQALLEDPIEDKKDLKKELRKLIKYNDIDGKSSSSFKEYITQLITLRNLQIEIDNTVLASYGWNKSSEKWGEAIIFNHAFYEIDYLPENDRIRFTISPESRKEILKRLLILNHERYEVEIKQGLHKKKDVEAFYMQKGKPIPAGIEFSDKKSKTSKRKGNKVEDPKEGYGGLFG